MQNSDYHLEKGFSKKINSIVVLLFLFSILYPITTEGVQNQGVQFYLEDENPSQQSSSPALSLFAGISEYNFSKLSSGMYNYHMCGLTNSSELFCWGANSNSQLGIGATGDVSSPTQVFASSINLSIVNVTTGISHSCIIVSNGDVECWGKGSLGRLGTGSTANLGSATSRVLLPL